MKSQNLLVIAALFALGFGGWSIANAMWPTPTEISTGEEPEEITYICTETGRLSVGEFMPTPAVNPATGRRTLVQGLFCEKCRKWYRSPPPELVHRFPRGPECPVTGDLLKVEGPLTVSSSL